MGWDGLDGMLRLYLNGLGWVGWFAQGVLGRILSNSPCRDHRGRGRGCSNWAENGFLHLSFSFRPNLNVWNIIFMSYIHIMHIYAHLCRPPSWSPASPSATVWSSLPTKLTLKRALLRFFLNFNPLIPGFNLKTWNQSFIQFNLHLISIKPLKFTALQVLKTAASFYGHAKLFQCQRWEENEWQEGK